MQRILGKFDWKGICLLCLLLLVLEDVNSQTDENALMKVVELQQGDTSEVNALLQLSQFYFRREPDKAVAYLQQGTELAQRLDFKRGLAESYRGWGAHYNTQGEHGAALKALEKSKVMYEAIGDQKGIVSCLNGFGNTAIRQGNADLALENFLSVAQLCEEMQDSACVARSYQNIGGIHYRQKQFDKAKDYIEKSLQLKLSLGDSSGIASTLSSLGSVFTAQGDYHKALEIQYRSLKFARKFSNPYEIASVLNNIGVQYHFLNQLDSARSYYLESMVIDRRLSEPQEMATQYINLGEIERLLGNGKQSIVYYDSSLAIAKKIGGKLYESESYRGFANSYEAMGNYKSALRSLKRFHALDDSLSGENVKRTINELQAKYDSGLKDKEIAELKKKEAEAVSTAEKQKSFLTLAISAALVLVLIALYLISHSKAKEKQRRIVLEQKALRAQMNPHFIFNSLGAMQSMYMSGETDLANNYLGDFGKLMRKILENSAKESISVKEELQMLQLYMNLEKERNGGLVDYEFQVGERVDQLGTHIPPMIIQPFLENAIWHGILPSKRSGKISLRLDIADKANYLRCVVEDDGVGLQVGKKTRGHVSKGISITEQRLGSKVKMESLSPGTRVTLKIPL